MNQQQTIEKMKSMRLLGMAETYYDNHQNNLYADHTKDEFIGLLVDQEWHSRQNKKIKN